MKRIIIIRIINTILIGTIYGYLFWNAYLDKSGNGYWDGKGEALAIAIPVTFIIMFCTIAWNEYKKTHSIKRAWKGFLAGPLAIISNDWPKKIK
jgi:hypothetical protein